MSPRSRAPRKTERITLRLWPEELEALNNLVSLRLVDSLSSAVREAVRDYVKNKIPQAPTVKATTTNVEELTKLAVEQVLKAQAQAVTRKKRQELSQP